MRTCRHPITVARQQRGLTRAQLAEQIGTIPENIEAWEHGLTYPEPRMALRMARTLQLSLAEVYVALAEAEVAAGRIPAAKPGPRSGEVRRRA